MTITSRQNPLVARFRDAARGDAGAVILLDGAHLVTDAIAAGVRIEHAVVTPAAHERPDVGALVQALTRSGVEVTTVSAPVMDAVSPLHAPTGIAALAHLPPSALDRLYQTASPLVVIAIDVQDPGNVGAIVRSAEAAGASGVVAAGISANPYGWRALRGSMGSALRLATMSGVAADAAIADARRRGCRVVAATPRGGVPLSEADLRGPLAVLIGGEGPGLPSSLIDAADARVTIPMQAPVESLNAAVTAALILYEARRQRAASAHESHETNEKHRSHEGRDRRKNTTQHR
jgi:TrmH family RNA methyltransferase